MLRTWRVMALGMLRTWRLALMSLAAVAGAAVAFAVATVPAAPARTSARPAKLSVGVEVLRFAAAGRKLSATGLVTAKLTDNGGHLVALPPTGAPGGSAGGGCRGPHPLLHGVLPQATRLHR